MIVDEIDRARAQEYALLAILLSRSPDDELIGRLALLRGDASSARRRRMRRSERLRLGRTRQAQGGSFSICSPGSDRARFCPMHRII